MQEIKEELAVNVLPFDAMKYLIDRICEVFTARQEFIKRTLPCEFERAMKGRGGGDRHLIPSFGNTLKAFSLCMEKYKHMASVGEFEVEQVCRDAWDIFSPLLPVWNNHRIVIQSKGSVVKGDPFWLFALLMEMFVRLRGNTEYGGEGVLGCCASASGPEIILSALSPEKSVFDESKKFIELLKNPTMKQCHSTGDKLVCEAAWQLGIEYSASVDTVRELVEECDTDELMDGYKLEIVIRFRN